MENNGTLSEMDWVLSESDMPTEPHANCCRNCPSQPGYPQDPESEDILTRWPLEDLKKPELLFPCGWRPEKLCKGWHDAVKSRIKELES